MLIKKPADMPSSEITPKGLYLNRRAFLGGAVVAGATALAGGLLKEPASPWQPALAGTKIDGIQKSRLTTVYDPGQMPGQRERVLEWPYVEGLRLDEAMHPLTLLCFGMYDELLPNQDGSPLRIVVPWKYGFKSAKAIVKIAFTERQPINTWNKATPNEYGFYSNVNPNVDHPRWSQARERRLGEFLKRPTLMFNGYGDQVASLYSGMDLKRYF